MGISPEQERTGGELLLSKIQILGEREGGIIEARVPIDLINREEVAVDENHVQDLAQSMKLEEEKGIENGQIQAVLLGQINGRSKFSLIDGFHRDSALELNGVQTVLASIMLRQTEEDVFDNRILTANSHKSVAFSRIYDWVGSAWEKSPWADKVTAVQAFSLANTKKATGRNIGLTPEEAEEIRTWALDKCERWRVSAFFIYNIMAVAQVADPELVQQTRNRASGHELLTVTQQHLKEIAFAYPKQFEVQRAIANVATTHALTVPQTKQAIATLQGITDSEEALAVIHATDWDAFFEEEKRAKQEKVRNSRKARISQGALPERVDMGSAHRHIATKYMLSRITIARLKIDNTLLRGGYVVPPMGSSSASTITTDIGQVQSLVEATKPSLDEDHKKAFSQRFKTVRFKLLEIFVSQSGASIEDAERGVNYIESRINRDMRSGSLKFVDFMGPKLYDELIRNCLNDEINRYLTASDAVVSPIRPRLTRVGLDTALQELPKLHEDAQSAFVYAGVLGLGSHSIAQFLGDTSHSVTSTLDLTRTTLQVAERINRRLDEKEEVSVAVNS